MTVSNHLTDEMREKLMQAGGPILNYLPENTYVMHCSPAQAEALASLEGVARVSHMKPEYKVSPAVYDLPTPRKEQLVTKQTVNTKKVSEARATTDANTFVLKGDMLDASKRDTRSDLATIAKEAEIMAREKYQQLQVRPLLHQFPHTLSCPPLATRDRSPVPSLDCR